jgi:iron complex transport system permease protein
MLALAQGSLWINPLTATEGWQATVVWELRLPRVLLAILVGSSLGLAGAALQGCLHNPLADPAIIGVSACAALGAVIAIYTGLAALAWFVLPLAGLLGATLSVALVWMLAGHQAGALSLILGGMAVNALVGALIALVLSVAENPFAMSEMLHWLLGSLANSSHYDVAVALPFVALGTFLLLRSRAFLDAMTLGEEAAASLGYPARRWRWTVVLAVAAAVGAAVSVSGNIGFVGLVVPHLLRPLVGHRPGALLLPSALGGALLLVLADLLVQNLSGNVELKLGVVTALLGAPFFLLLIVRYRRSLW